MKILAITSSYPRYEGDATAPFIESIVDGVAARGDTDARPRPGERRLEIGRPSKGRPLPPVPLLAEESWTPWGFSEALERRPRIRRSLYGLAPIVFGSALRAARSISAASASKSSTCTGSCRTGRSWRDHRPALGLPLVVSLHGSDVAVAERSGASARCALDVRPRVRGHCAERRPARASGSARGHQPLERIPYGADVEAIAGSGAPSDARAAPAWSSRTGRPRGSGASSGERLRRPLEAMAAADVRA